MDAEWIVLVALVAVYVTVIRRHIPVRIRPSRNVWYTSDLLPRAMVGIWGALILFGTCITTYCAYFAPSPLCYVFDIAVGISIVILGDYLRGFVSVDHMAVTLYNRLMSLLVLVEVR